MPEFPSLDWFAANNYIRPRQLADGSWAALYRLFTTMSIVMGMDEFSWKYRFCFKSDAKAVEEFEKLQTVDDIPEGFVSHRPEYRKV